MINTTKMRKNAAFTLVELVIVMALTLIVGGLVTSYIVFTTKFNERTKAAYERVEQFTMLREEITSWFSLADNSDYTITINDENSAVKVTATKGENQALTITFSDGEMTFVYPQIDGFTKEQKTVKCDYVTEIKFYDFENYTSVDQTEDGDLRFTIQMNVTGGLYACEIFG